MSSYAIEAIFGKELTWAVILAIVFKQSFSNFKVLNSTRNTFRKHNIVRATRGFVMFVKY